MACGLVKEDDRGRYEPAPFDGSGISEAPQYLLDRQFVAPHTGIIYTPPKFSDHVAVSIVLGEDCSAMEGMDRPPTTMPSKLVLTRDAATRRTQPHAQQQTIFTLMANRQTSSQQPKGEQHQCPVVKDTDVFQAYDKTETPSSLLEKSGAPIKPQATSLSSSGRPTFAASRTKSNGSTGKGTKRSTPLKGQLSILSMFQKQQKTADDK